MPKKRPLDVRLAEHQEKLDDLKLEKAIADMKAKRDSRQRPRRRVRR
jgi:hypothetical protein